jgi:hypothetical protein
VLSQNSKQPLNAIILAPNNKERIGFLLSLFLPESHFISILQISLKAYFGMGHKLVILYHDKQKVLSITRSNLF